MTKYDQFKGVVCVTSESSTLQGQKHTGWWFGTCFISHNIWKQSSQLTFIIFRGVGQPPTSIWFPNHQMRPSYSMLLDPDGPGSARAI